MGPGLGYHGPRNTKEEEEETMAHYVTGPAIKALRERKGLTQKPVSYTHLQEQGLQLFSPEGGGHRFGHLGHICHQRSGLSHRVILAEGDKIVMLPAQEFPDAVSYTHLHETNSFGGG